MGGYRRPVPEPLLWLILFLDVAFPPTMLDCLISDHSLRVFSVFTITYPSLLTKFWCSRPILFAILPLISDIQH